MEKQEELEKLTDEEVQMIIQILDNTPTKDLRSAQRLMSLQEKLKKMVLKK